MPRRDGMGPEGLGPLTGRAAGYCAGSSTPGCQNPVLGRRRLLRWPFFGRGSGEAGVLPQGSGRGLRRVPRTLGLGIGRRGRGRRGRR